MRDNDDMIINVEKQSRSFRFSPCTKGSRVNTQAWIILPAVSCDCCNGWILCICG